MNDLRKYVEEIKKKSFKSNKKIFVYGAGKIAHNILSICRQNGIRIDGFIVSSLNNNYSNLEGITVFEYGNIPVPLKHILLIMGFADRRQEIEPHLTEMGFETVVPFYEFLLNYSEWDELRYKNPVMEIVPKIGCIVNCRFCPQKVFVSRYYENDKNRKTYMSFDDYKRYLDLMPNNMIIDWSGFVEPFLNSESIEMMEYTSKTHHKQALFTTLVGVSIEQIKRLVNIPFDWVVLHVADKYGYAGIDVSEEYLEKIDYLLDAKKKDGSPFINGANCQFDPDERVTEITRGKLKIASELQDRAGNLDHSDSRLVTKYTNGEIRCERSSVLNHNVLLADGTVVLCCNDFGMECVLGNLNKQSYEQIISSETLIEVKRKMITGKPVICRKCMYACKIEKGNLE